MSTPTNYGTNVAQMRTRGSWQSRLSLVLVAAIALILMGVAAGVWWFHAEEEQPSASRPLPINAAIAEISDSYEIVHTYSGVIKPRRAASVSFGRAGRIVKMLVDEGAQVSAGQPLAELDKRRLNIRRSQLQAARSKALATQDQLLANGLANPQEILAATSELANELQSLRQQLTELGPADTVQGLLARTAASEQRLRAIEAAAGQGGLVAASAAVAELDARLAEVDLELEECVVTAPFGGRIAGCYVSEGETVAAGSPVARLLESGRPEAWIAVPANLATEMRVGSTHVIYASGSQVDAIVSARIPEVQMATRTRMLIFALSPAESPELLASLMDILPGTLAHVEVRRTVNTPGFWLPLESLTRASQGLWSVLVVEAGTDGTQRVVRRYVQVVHVKGKQARIEGSLDAGDQVVVNGTHRVVPGQRVTVDGGT